MTRVYHGTITGKNDLFLESFIITGAMSHTQGHKSADPWDQAEGFYVVLEPMAGFSADHSHTGLQRMLVELDVKIDADNWGIDHEMSAGYSLALIYQMRDFFPVLQERCHGAGLNAFLSAINEGRNFEIEGTLYMWPVSKNASGDRRLAHALQQVHGALKDSFPDEYRTAKQQILDEIVEKKDANIKYVGSEPLPVSKIYLCPQDEFKPEEQWSVAYDVSAGIKPKLKGTGADATAGLSRPPSEPDGNFYTRFRME